MLNEFEKEYFTTVLNSIISNLNLTINIPVIPYDHTKLHGRFKESLGCAWSYDKKIVYKITIDEEFIKACYQQDLWKKHKGGFPKSYPEELENVICHEIAHISFFRHGKKHSELTNKLINKYLITQKNSI